MNGKGNALIAAGEEWLRTYPRKRMIPVIGLLHYARNAVDRNLKSRLTRMRKKMPKVSENAPILGMLVNFRHFRHFALFLEHTTETALDTVPDGFGF